MSWIQTYTGKKFDLVQPAIESVDIVDIAHALSHQCRFNGHTRSFYSVAQHCVHVSEKVGNDPRACLVALLHDAHEAYTGDIVTPMKRLLGAELDAIEEEIQTIVWLACDVDLGWVEEFYDDVKNADIRMLVTERMNLMSEPPADWGIRVKPFLLGPADGLAPEHAKESFLCRYDELQGKCDKWVMEDFRGNP